MLFQVSIQNADDAGTGILPYRVSRSDWEKIRRELGYQGTSVARAMGNLAGAAGRVRVIATVLAWLRQFLGPG